MNYFLNTFLLLGERAAIKSRRLLINYLNSDIYNSTNTVVYFNGKDGNLYLRAMSHTINTAFISYLNMTLCKQMCDLIR
jgi:hypothetical protein